MTNAPLVTLGLLTYRRERHVREAVRSVLAQTYSPLQIVICDDASPDATAAIVDEELRAYRGPHKIVFYKGEQNQGIGNYNTLMKLAKGELIVVAHDDDISFPYRVERLAAAWRKSGASLVSSNSIVIAEDGEELGLFSDPAAPTAITAEDIAAKEWNMWLFGGGLAWERRVFDVFGPLDANKSALITDWILPFRASLLGGIAIVEEPLLLQRRHTDSKRAKLYGDHADKLALGEIELANALNQYYYMADTLEEARGKQLLPEARIAALRNTLLQSILTTGNNWRRVRNRLLAGGRRPRWLTPGQ